MKRPARGLILLLLTVMPLVASAQAHQLKVYYAGPAAVAREIESAFEEFRGDVLKIEPMPPMSEAIAEASSGADVVWGGGEILHKRLQDLRRLRSYRSSQVRASEARRMTDSSHFPATGEQLLVLVYDPAAVAGGFTGWRDLLDSRWRGRIALADPARSEEGSLAAAALQQLLGWPFLENLSRLAPILTATLSDVAAAVASGKAAVGVGVYPGPAGDGPVTIAWPKEGALALVQPISIIEKNGRPGMMTGLAEQLVDYVLSAEGRRIGSRYGLVPLGRESEAAAGAVVKQPDLEDLLARAPEVGERLNSMFSAAQP